MSRRTFDEFYAWELGKQRESKTNTTICAAFGAVCILLAIFKHPAWLIVTGLTGLFYWFHKAMHGGDRDLTTPAARQACEFMVQVRESGHARSLLSLSGVVTIMQLALGEYYESDPNAMREKKPADQIAWPGARIARNLSFKCAHCPQAADQSVTGAWWAATVAFKRFADREKYLRPDGTCAKCGATEGWFESRHP